MLSTQRVSVAGISVDSRLYEFVNEQALPGTNIDADHFWQSFAEIINDLADKNKQLLDRRDELQDQIDQWYKTNGAQDAEAEKSFLKNIGYIAEKGEDFKVKVDNVDLEIARIAGPQLVVPVDNARYALNACNARWGSLYDALYGSDVIFEEQGCKRTKKYNPVRGNKVIKYARDFLDRTVPLAVGSHSYVVKYMIKSGDLIAVMGDGSKTPLGHRERFVGYTGDPQSPDSILFQKNNLHIEVCIGEGYFIGKGDLANVYDIKLESAITTIMDCEDSVAAVDAEDKLRCYSNWLGLMKGGLKEKLTKDGKEIERVMQADREFIDSNGQIFKVPGRSLMLLRNVGIHMYTDAVTDEYGNEIPEGFLDAMVTILCAKHDLMGNGNFRNSRTGSIYIVKPKLHGPDEVEATAELFSRVEQALGLEANTVKIGVMDEERRTTVNLSECIRRVAQRIIFINTGFLDRTGDEIHTCMEAGISLPKTRMKSAQWLLAYEDWNVDVGLSTGLPGYAQIGKGMWAAPDNMAEMMDVKIVHPRAGANTAWVPSPTAATLHVMHYHRVNVRYRQQQLVKHLTAHLSDILTIPVIGKNQLSQREIRNELENNAQSILGYVVRWIDQGVGCSKVPDINDTALMEDRATLRISSQQLANWLYHGLISEQQIKDVFADMAWVVDWQNHTDPNYVSMHPDLDNSIAYQAALDLVFKGCEVANGYTEPVLHARRKQRKQQLSG